MKLRFHYPRCQTHDSNGGASRHEVGGGGVRNDGDHALKNFGKNPILNIEMLPFEYRDSPNLDKK